MAHSLCVGMAFVGAYSSYAQYPDAESLLGRLGIKIDNDKLVADGTGGYLPEVFALTMQDSKKLTALCGDKTALKERRWSSCCFSDVPVYCDDDFMLEMGMAVDTEGPFLIGDLVRSREFLTGVFGEDFVSEFLKTVAESSGRVYTNLTSCIDFQEYRCLCEKLQEHERWKVRGKMDKEDSIVVKNYSLCGKVYLERQKEIKSQIAECEELLKKYVPQNERYELLWENWSVFQKISCDSDRNKVLLAEEGFLRALGHVLGLRNYKHPVRIALSKVRTLLPEYLKSCSLFKKALRKKWEEEEEKEKVRNEIKKPFEEYRNRFAGGGYLTNEKTRKKIPISTEPVTVDIWIYQEHFEDKDGTRKLHGEGWDQRVADLDIKLRLTIDTRTRKLLSAFCRKKFVVNGQSATDFGTDGLCIFKSKQP